MRITLKRGTAFYEFIKIATDKVDNNPCVFFFFFRTKNAENFLRLQITEFIGNRYAIWWFRWLMTDGFKIRKVLRIKHGMRVGSRLDGKIFDWKVRGSEGALLIFLWCMIEKKFINNFFFNFKFSISMYER